MSEQSTTQPLGSGEQIFNQFCDSNNFREILQLFNTLCSELKVDPNQYEGFYPSLKSCLTSWKATSLFKLLDDRSSLPEYEGGRACAGRRVLVVGAGPVGLRGAIELALLGARVDLVEKRPDFQRNNSLHLWPFLITDLRNLGAKKFYGRFASGSIEHICELHNHPVHFQCNNVYSVHIETSIHSGNVTLLEHNCLKQFPM